MIAAPLWWQKYVAGVFKTPRSVYRAALASVPAAPLRFETGDDGGAWDVPERLKSPRAFVGNAILRQHDLADWQNADPRLMRFVFVFVEMARQRQIPLYVHSCFRTPEAQARLKAGGRSRAGAGRSPHNIGEAVDIVHSVFHWDLTRDEWAFLHVLGRLALDRVNATLPKNEKLSLVWGGSFKTLYDPAHWEIEDFRKRLGPRPVGTPRRFTPRGLTNSPGR